MEQNAQTPLFELQLDQQASAYLGDTARWAKFLAIVGFIFCALIVIVAIFAGSIFSAMFGRMGGQMGTNSLDGVGAAGGAFIAVLYILIALLYFFPLLYLYNFATKMRAALRSNDQVQLTASLRNLKACFRFIGVLTIISLGFMALGLLFGIIGMAFH
jgi:hypothetical protein